MNENLDNLLQKALSINQTKSLLRQLGFSTELPYVISSIDDDAPYSPNDVAKLLNLSRQHVCRLCTAGKIASVQVTPKGKHIIYGNIIKQFILAHIAHPAYLSKIFNQ